MGTAWELAAKMLREAGPSKGDFTISSTLPDGSKKLRSEFEKTLHTASEQIMQLYNRQKDMLAAQRREEILKILRSMVRIIELEEGEDPAELDPGGPKPGTTGTQK
jgi:hypothetical protein